MTEATKQKMAEFEPMLAKGHESYDRTLAAVDSKLETVAVEVSANARRRMPPEIRRPKRKDE